MLLPYDDAPRPQMMKRVMAFAALLAALAAAAAPMVAASTYAPP